MDNITAPATGAVLATDEIEGIHYPRSKVGFGADGAFSDVSSTTPLPVAIISGGGSGGGGGDASAANQATEIARLTSILSSVDGLEGLLATVNTLLGGTLTINLPSGAATATGVAAVKTAVDNLTAAIGSGSGGGTVGGATETTLAAMSAKLPASLGPKAVSTSLSIVPATSSDMATNAGIAAALGGVSYYPATQPVSGTVGLLGTVAVSGPLTDAQLRATAVPVSVGGSIAVTGTFFQATQPISAAALPLPSGAATSAKQDAIVTALGSPLQAGGNVAVTASALPTGAATAVKQDAQTAAIGTIGTRAYQGGITALSAGTSSTASAAITATEVLLHASAKCFVRAGVAATVNDIPLEAGEKFTLRIISGQTINAITATGTATLNIVPVA